MPLISAQDAYLFLGVGGGSILEGGRLFEGAGGGAYSKFYKNHEFLWKMT